MEFEDPCVGVTIRYPRDPGDNGSYTVSISGTLAQFENFGENWDKYEFPENIKFWAKSPKTFIKRLTEREIE